MADGKRQSFGGRPTGGPSMPQPPVNLEAALSGVIGARIRLELAPPVPSTLEGTVFAACQISNLIAINTSPLPPTPITANTPALAQPSDFHVIPISRIQHYQLLSLAPSVSDAASGPEREQPSFSDAYPSIYPIDVRAVKKREAAAIAKLQERERRRGKGVSKEAQDIFDAFSKTMPTHWQGTGIVVADTVIIAPPYKAENCRSVADDDSGAVSALPRVRKVLEMERKKIEARNASAEATRSSSDPSAKTANGHSNGEGVAHDGKAIAVPVTNQRPTSWIQNPRKGG